MLAARIAAAAFDHKNNADIGSNLANQLFDLEKVASNLDTPNSRVALAVKEIATNKVVINSGAWSDFTATSAPPATSTRSARPYRPRKRSVR